MYTLFDIKDTASIRVDEENKVITLRFKSHPETVFITEEDELYQNHIDNINRMKNAIVEAFIGSHQESEGKGSQC